MSTLLQGKHYRITSIEDGVVHAKLFAIVKAGPPDEPRDKSGKWTIGGSKLQSIRLAYRETSNFVSGKSAGQVLTEVAKHPRTKQSLKELVAFALKSFVAHVSQQHGSFQDSHVDEFIAHTVHNLSDATKLTKSQTHEMLKRSVEALKTLRRKSKKPDVEKAVDPVYECLTQLGEALDRYDPETDLEKFNPYHDERGRFSTGSGGMSAKALLSKNFDHSTTFYNVWNRLPQETQKKIDEAKHLIATSPSSKEQHTLPDGSYTPEREALHKNMLEKLFTADVIKNASPKPGTKPELIMTGGRPGSGKTSALQGIDQSKYFYLSADTIRESMPGYNGANAELYLPEARDVVAQAERIARSAGLNIIYDATMAVTQQAKDRVALYKAQGYDVNGYYVHAAPDTATTRAMSRFMKTGYFVPPEVPFNQRTNEVTFDTIKPQLKHWVLIDNNGAKAKMVAQGNN